MPFLAIDPSTERELRSIPFVPPEECAVLLGRSRAAYEHWKKTEPRARIEPVRAIGELIKKRAPEIAATMAQEMGKPVREGVAECEKCAGLAAYYADNVVRFLQPEEGLADGHARVVFEPLGAILLIMPWNFPCWQVFRAAIPALMAGNTVVLKHAENVPGSALALEQLFLDAGFPPGAFTNIFADHTATAAMIADPIIAGVSLTGSTRAGRVVAELAGRSLKKCVLELGGSDPYIILDDADLELTVEACATGRLINGGQSCIAAKRFIVTEQIHDAFLSGLRKRLGAVEFGPPLDAKTALGPLAREDLRANLHRQVSESVRLGGKLELGGYVPDGSGFFYPPTIVSDSRPGMPVFDEETFGPVAAVVRAKNEEHAVALANESNYGLGAAIFTKDVTRAMAMVPSIQAGSVFINGFVRSDQRLPFGGIRDSGFGRELSRYGLLEFTNVKTLFNVPTTF